MCGRAPTWRERENMNSTSASLDIDESVDGWTEPTGDEETDLGDNPLKHL